MSAAPATVLIHGCGVAAATATRLLADDGFALAGEREGSRSSAPVVMLSDQALALLRDLFGRADLFAGRPRIMRRIVAWGDAELVTFPHAAIAVSGSEIAAELALSPLQGDAVIAAKIHTATLAVPRRTPGPRSHTLGVRDSWAPAFAGEQNMLESSPALLSPLPETFFTIHAATPFPADAMRRFGQREAMAAAVDLAPEADAQACYVEATDSGWLFLIPQGARRAWLLAVGGTPDALLGRSRLVAAQVRDVDPVTARFETAPRMLETMAGDDWLACGTAAIAFDPICGDGTAQAAREAILAAAVIAALREGGDPAPLLGHYQSMLIAAMRRHLQISLSFYRSGGTSPWWRAQADALADGHAWCTARLATMPEPRFLLRGTRLVLREQAA